MQHGWLRWFDQRGYSRSTSFKNSEHVLLQQPMLMCSYPLPIVISPSQVCLHDQSKYGGNDRARQQKGREKSPVGRSRIYLDEQAHDGGFKASDFETVGLLFNRRTCWESKGADTPFGIAREALAKLQSTCTSQMRVINWPKASHLIEQRWQPRHPDSSAFFLEIYNLWVHG